MLVSITVNLSEVMVRAINHYHNHPTNNGSYYGTYAYDTDSMEALVANIAKICDAGHKITMIKAIRATSGWGLREAKTFADNCQAYKHVTIEHAIMKNIFGY